jgi:hypothetical protein
MSYIGLSGTDCSSRITPTTRASAADLDCYAARMVQATNNASAAVRAQWMVAVHSADRAAFYSLLAKHKMRTDRIAELKAKFPPQSSPSGPPLTGGGMFGGGTAGILASILKPGVPAPAPAGGGAFVPGTSWLPGATAASPAAPISSAPLGPDGAPGPSAGAQAMLRSAASDMRARGVFIAPELTSGPNALPGFKTGLMGTKRLPLMLALGGAAVLGIYLITRKKTKKSA